MRRMSVDPGQKRVGLAMCDEDSDLAYPFATLPGEGGPAEVAARVAATAREEGVGEIVLGLPLSLDGREGPAARKARSLARALETALEGEVAVHLLDERLTTVSASRQMRAAGVSARKQRDRIDQAAATVLLQAYLDGLRARSGDGY